MAAIESLGIQDEKFSSLGLSKTVVNKEQVVCYTRTLGAASEKNPILVLIHGYPQSAYEWRHLIPLLPKDTPLFVPDLPGYGGSAAIEINDKLTIGSALLAALKTEFIRTSTSTSANNIPIILIGHDRGARVAHRLTVTGYEGFNIIGVSIMDVVPTCIQWCHSNSPSRVAKEVSGYFHWPFLANVSLATRMITAYGGSTWCTERIKAWAGKNLTGLAKLESDNALAVYGGYFEREETIVASCEDYKHGATTDVEAQERDQAEGKKINVPVLLVYSQDYIGKRFDLKEVWKDWVSDGVEITSHALKDGIGHFGAEEAPEESAKAILEWLKGLL